MRFSLGLVFAALLFAQHWGSRSPRVVSQSEPEYSEEARRAGVNSTVIANLVVDEAGVPRDIQIVRAAGFGLDEMAVRSIASWQFEPGSKEGKPYAVATNVDVHFQIADKLHARQMVRLNFGSGGIVRPELIQGQIPPNPEPPVKASMRIRFTVRPDGQPEDFQILETDNREWTTRALWEMAAWRFRPALRAGQPEEIKGVFELTVTEPVPQSRPSLTSMVSISPPTPEDTSLAAPKLIAPPDHAIFDGYPRRVTCKWEASPDAFSYLLEWDYMDRDNWNTEYRSIPGMAMPVNGTEASFNFVGAQPGRWRVWPVSERGRRGNPSEWRTFRYLH